MGVIMLDSSPIQGKDLASLFRPSFLRKFEGGQHRGHLRRMRIVEFASKFSSLSAFLEAVYERLENEYRCEYVFKNALLNDGPAAALIAPHFAVYTELPLAHFEGRVDMLLCENTTTSFEVKSDVDGLGRLAAQIEMNERLFDYNYVVCSNDTLTDVRTIANDTRAGIFVFDSAGFALAKKAKSNAKFVNPDAVFGTLRSAERLMILRRHGMESRVAPAREFTVSRTKFGRLSPYQAHQGLLDALRCRPNGLTKIGQLFKELPRCMKHVLFQSKEAERNRILDMRVLARSVT